MNTASAGAESNAGGVAGGYAGKETKREEFENAKQAAIDAWANFVEAKNHLKLAAKAAGVEFREVANEHFVDARDRVKEQKTELYEHTCEYVREYPLRSAGIAFLGGVLFSKMMDR